MRARAAATSVLAVACGLHFLHDGLAELLYVLFPVWAGEFGLSFARVGVLRSAYSGALAAFQLPAGFLAERLGEARVLAAGTLVTGLGFLLLGTAGVYPVLLLFLLVGGLGAGTQHPLTSSLVSQAYEEGRRRVALGTYNFAGDVGKVAWTALAGLLVAWLGWPWATRTIGLLVLSAGLGLALAALRQPAAGRRRAGGASRAGDWGIREGRGFLRLSAIHSLDSAGRAAFLTFLPFVLLAKGAPLPLLGVALGLTLAGGAAGKFACGALAERLGIVRTVLLTEVATAAGVLLLIQAPLAASLALLPLIGVALNGTSSVLYGTVPEFVAPDRRPRAYGLFYTVGIGAAALAPPAFGLLSDRAGLPLTLATLAAVILLTLPLAASLRPALQGVER